MMYALVCQWSIETYWSMCMYVCHEVLFCREPLDIAVESLSICQFDAVSYLFLFECIYYYSKTGNAWIVFDT